MWCRLLIKAQDWLASAGALSRQRVPLKKMREALHAGQRLGVDISEVDQLRLDIRRREWEDQVKKVPSRTFQHPHHSECWPSQRSCTPECVKYKDLHCPFSQISASAPCTSGLASAFSNTPGSSL